MVSLRCVPFHRKFKNLDKRWQRLLTFFFTYFIFSFDVLQINVKKIEIGTLFFFQTSSAQIIRTYTYVPTTTTTITSATALPQCEYESCRYSIEDLGSLIQIMKSLNNKNSSNKGLSEDIILKLINALVYTSSYNHKSSVVHGTGSSSNVNPGNVGKPSISGKGTNGATDVKAVKPVGDAVDVSTVKTASKTGTGDSGSIVSKNTASSTGDKSSDNVKDPVIVNNNNKSNRSDTKDDSNSKIDGIRNVKNVGNATSISNTGNLGSNKEPGNVGVVKNSSSVGNLDGVNNSTHPSIAGGLGNTGGLLNIGSKDNTGGVDKIDSTGSTGGFPNIGSTDNKGVVENISSTGNMGSVANTGGVSNNNKTKEKSG